MGKHSKECGHTPVAAFRECLASFSRRRPARYRSGEHRVQLRNKVMAGVFAAGAFAAAGQPLGYGKNGSETAASIYPVASNRDDLRAALGDTTLDPDAITLLEPVTEHDSREEAEKIDKSKAIEQARAAAEQAEREAAERAAELRAAAEKAAAEQQAEAQREAQRLRASFIKPAEGTFTSGFGARWGTVHQGIDIANSIGTPIRAAAAGTVINAGPASGFGLWVRVRHDDGTITVYGHVNTIGVRVGERVGAGEQIATMGNRGETTGPHLHFEVITPSGAKTNPLPWLARRGISVG